MSHKSGYDHYIDGQQWSILAHIISMVALPFPIWRQIEYLENQGIIDSSLSAAAKHSKLKVLLAPMTIGSLDNPVEADKAMLFLPVNEKAQ
jgi:hypothetical protein